MKESSYLNRETNAEELEKENTEGDRNDNINPLPMKEGIPIRR